MPIVICWTLYCKCTNFQANHNRITLERKFKTVGLYIANVLTFKRITTQPHGRMRDVLLDSILQMY